MVLFIFSEFLLELTMALGQQTKSNLQRVKLLHGAKQVRRKTQVGIKLLIFFNKSSITIQVNQPVLKLNFNCSDRFTKQPLIKTQDDIVLENVKNEKNLQEANNVQNGIGKENSVAVLNDQPVTKVNDAVEKNNMLPVEEINNDEQKKELNQIEENDSLMANGHNDIENNETEEMEVNTDTDVVSEMEEESIQEDVTESITEEISQGASKEDDIINEVLEETSLDESVSKLEEDNVLNSILSDSDEQILGNSNDNDER